MKYCFALILSFLSLSLFAIAGFEVTEYNGVRKEAVRADLLQFFPEKCRLQKNGR